MEGCPLILLEIQQELAHLVLVLMQIEDQIGQNRWERLIMKPFQEKGWVLMLPHLDSIPIRYFTGSHWNLKCQDLENTAEQLKMTNHMEDLRHIPNLEINTLNMLLSSIPVREDLRIKESIVIYTSLELIMEWVLEHTSQMKIQWSRKALTCQWNTLISYDYFDLFYR